MSVDRDIELARDALRHGDKYLVRDYLEKMISHVEERIRVNVGLLTENRALKRELAQRPPVKETGAK